MWIPPAVSSGVSNIAISPCHWPSTFVLDEVANHSIILFGLNGIAACQGFRRMLPTVSTGAQQIP